MKITTLEASKYKGFNVYIRNYKNMFEYLAIVNGELYTAHMVINKTFIQSLLGRPYTEKQLEDVRKYLMNTAQATIEYLLENKKVSNTRKAKPRVKNK